VTEDVEFSRYSSVAPGRVVGGHVDDESADLDRGGWPSGSSGGLGPVAVDSLPVPAQQGVGGDEPTGASRAGECLGDRAKHGPVVVVEFGPVVLSAQHDQLVA
jgi:hypothetical protein